MGAYSRLGAYSNKYGNFWKMILKIASFIYLFVCLFALVAVKTDRKEDRRKREIKEQERRVKFFSLKVDVISDIWRIITTNSRLLENANERPWKLD